MSSDKNLLVLSLCHVTVMCLQYATMQDGSALGVAVTRSSLLTHCRSLSTACLYREGECCRSNKRGIIVVLKGCSMEGKISLF